MIKIPEAYQLNETDIKLAIEFYLQKLYSTNDSFDITIVTNKKVTAGRGMSDWSDADEYSAVATKK